MNELSDFKKGMRVAYIPSHMSMIQYLKTGKLIDAETGVVSSTNYKFVFVKYDQNNLTFSTGDEPYTAAATKPEDLIILEK